MIPGLTKRILVIDAETASPVDIKKEGAYRYWENPETETLMVGYKWLGETHTGVTDLATGEMLPREIVYAARAPRSEVILAAANAPFDQRALERIGFPTPDDKWLDIFTCAYTLGFSGRLNDVLRQVFNDPGMLKDAAGTRCITYFSVQRNPWYSNPELWDEFVGYCRQDAEVEEQLLRWCLQWLTQPWFLPSFLEIHQQDLIYRRINARGLPIDQEAVRGAIKIRDTAHARLLAELKELTGLDNPNSRDQMLKWCQGQGALIADLKKDTVRDEITRLESAGNTGHLPLAQDKLLRALRLRQKLAKTSTAKYDAMARATSDDGRLRGGWQFYGASRTGRVAGRVLNPANLATPPDDFPADAIAEWLKLGDLDLLTTAWPQYDALTTLSYCIRSMVCAPDGHQIVDADLTSIESVGSAWLVGCKTVLNVFAAGRDTYKTMASDGEGIPYEEVTKAQRKFYKPVVLGGVYMLGARGLVRYAEAFGQDLSLDDAKKQIATLRTTWHEYPEYWRQLNMAAISAVKYPGEMFTARAVRDSARQPDGSYVYTYADWPVVQYWCAPDKTFLFCKLPSGRFLCYFQPDVAPATIGAGTDHEFHIDEALYYYGTDQRTGQWRRINVHAGSLLENITQALCRDVLWTGLKLTDADPDMDIILEVYDELGALVKSTDRTALERLIGNLTTRAPWLDDTFFLGADGYLSGRFKK